MLRLDGNENCAKGPENVNITKRYLTIREMSIARQRIEGTRNYEEKMLLRTRKEWKERIWSSEALSFVFAVEESWV